MGIRTSPERFAAAIDRVAQAAEQAGRDNVSWQHNMTIRCGLGSDLDRAARAVRDAMQSVYRLEPDAFARWCPAGTPAIVDSASRQPAGRVGLHNTADVLLTRTELPSIAAGRQARLRSYNDYREACKFQTGHHVVP